MEQSLNEPIQRHVLPEEAVEKSVRLVGGVQSLIDAIADSLPPSTVKLNTCVTAIQMNDHGTTTVEAVLGDGKKKTIRAKAVILALPPNCGTTDNILTFSTTEFMASLVDKLHGWQDRLRWLQYIIALFGETMDFPAK